MRKNRPSQACQTVLGIKLSLRIVCALGESALPSVSGLWSLVSSGGALPPGAQANEMRKNRPKPCLSDGPWHQAFTPHCLRSRRERATSGVWPLVSSGGALPPGARANEMRKNRPSQVYQTVLGIKLSPCIVCALGESALPSASGLWCLTSDLFRWRATAGSAGQ